MKVIYRGNSFCIVENGERLQISCEEGVVGKIAYYDISKENAAKAMKSDRDSYEVIMFAKTGKWPPAESERQEINKEFIRKFPKLVLKNPENQKLFDSAELKALMNKAIEK